MAIDQLSGGGDSNLAKDSDSEPDSCQKEEVPATICQREDGNQIIPVPVVSTKSRTRSCIANLQFRFIVWLARVLCRNQILVQVHKKQNKNQHKK
jgi:hypothetical protein